MKRSLWIGLVVIVLAAGGIFGITQKTKHSSASASNATTQTQSNVVSYKGENGKNAMELLKQHATVETTVSPSMGEYVTSINGIASGTDSKYWIVYVNNAPASTGASDIITKSTDTIDWKLE